jgi:hypothetical protein
MGRLFRAASSLSVSTALPPFSALRPLRGPEQYRYVHRFAGETREPERSAPILSGPVPNPVEKRNGVVSGC